MPSALTEKSSERRLKRRGGSITSHGGSTTHGAAGGLHHKQGSMSSISFFDDHSHEDPSKSLQRLENTYQLTPDRKFLAAQARHILQEVIEGYLAEEKYDAELCRQMARTIADVAKARVKELLYARYKIVCLIHVGQLRDQGLVLGSRCLWDTSNDTFACYEFRNGSLFAVGVIYAVYYE